jgi:hypothetical protein
MNYRIVSIPDRISTEVRTTRRSPQYRSHPAHVATATGYGPCRTCLRTFEVGKEERILFTYDPFEGLSSLPAPGPILIHLDACPSYASRQFPVDLRELPLLLEAYGSESELIRREKVVANRVEAQIDDLLTLKEVNFINLRNFEAGCFVARVERDS